ncbi:MAG TPA: hypothetical protein VNG71_16100 [Pyrinomonadaceae bacterium]|nr:hypothetical protein [Pyrinomonadaceae bacterium]
MKNALCLALSYLLLATTVGAQSPTASTTAANPVQLSQPESATPPPAVRELKIPAGTPLEIETAFTVNSQYVRPEELISFRVLVPVRVDGLTVIEKYSLVTGRVVEAKRGRHWGRAGKLSWIMQDVVAVDLTRVPLQAVRDTPAGTNRVAGTSHGGQVAAQIAIAAPLMLFAAPLALTAGFKRGENAMLPEGKRFIVYVAKDTTVHTTESPAEPQPLKP